MIFETDVSWAADHVLGFGAELTRACFRSTDRGAGGDSTLDLPDLQDIVAIEGCGDWCGISALERFGHFRRMSSWWPMIPFRVVLP